MARLALLASMLLGPALRAAEYQWSAPIEPTLPDPNRHPRAFLWIPPTCTSVRAVVIGEHNMLEEGIFEHPIFRQAMSDLGFAVVWISPSFDCVFRFDLGAGERLDGLLQTLAQESGYGELATAPIVPLGHSAHASYPWNFGAWAPGRTLAMLSVKGDAPLTNMTGSGKPNPDWGDRSIDGVPGLMVMGEYEWLQGRLDPALDFQKKHPLAPICLLADEGRGHFDTSDALVRYLTLFLRKAALYRLPAESIPPGQPVKLKPIDPQQGWLVDQWRHSQPRKVPAAPYSKYQGNRDEAFWCFDRELAEVTERFGSQGGKAPQLLGYEQAGEVAGQTVSHQQVTLKLPPLDESLTFRLHGVFLDKVPSGAVGNPSRWTGLTPDAPIGHATGGGPVQISRVAGPLAAIGPDAWTIRFHRGSDVTDRSRKTEDLWFIATHGGDDQYKSAVQQAMLRVPVRNTTGAPQHLTFPEIGDQKNTASSLKLNATSDAGVPVYYYVREGPAEIAPDGTLWFTPVPPRAKYPIRVTVVAWQWGRTTEPKLQSAEPIERTFQIVK